MSKKKENFDQVTNQQIPPQQVEKDVAGFARILILLIVIDLIFIVFALYCLFASGIPIYFVIPLFILMLTPGLGFAVALGVIVYHFTHKKAAVPVPVAKYHFF